MNLRNPNPRLTAWRGFAQATPALQVALKLHARKGLRDFSPAELPAAVRLEFIALKAKFWHA